MALELPFPAKILWPNGRGHHLAKWTATQRHRGWAKLATWADNTRDVIPPAATVKVMITVYPKTRNRIDADNALAAMKSYIDGIADGLGVDDSRFVYAPVQFGEPVKYGKVVIAVEVVP